MKFSTVALVLAATAEAVPQFGGGKSEWTFVGKKDVKPKYRANAKRQILSYGPIVLYGKDEKKPTGSGMSMDPKGQSGGGSISKGLCTSCTLLSGQWGLRYKNGSIASPASGVYIHHMLSFDISKKAHNPITGGSTGGTNLPIAAFVDRGEDSGEGDTVFTNEGTGKVAGGFHLPKPTLSVTYDIVNYREEKQNIYVDLEVEYLDGIVGKDAGHTLKTVSGRIPLGQTGPATSKSTIMKVTEDATIVWARGHLHAGGESTVLMVNGKDVCKSDPTYNKAGVITSMALCPEPIDVKKGDTMQMRAVYDIQKHKLRQATDGSSKGAHGITGSDVMGMFGMSYVVNA